VALLVGALLALAVGLMTTAIGMDRDRALYPARSDRRNQTRRAAPLFVSLIGLMPIALAQEPPNGESSADPTRVTVEKEGSATRVTVQSELAIEIEIPATTTASCEATLALEYTQRGTIARVESVIENATCAASGGDYTIAIRVRDAKGEITILEFDEPWQRSDDQPVEFLADYPIGEDVELVGVRSRRLRCVCADASRD
jgi:hypothetical protein